MEARATAAMLLTVAAVAAVGSSAGVAMAKGEPMGAASAWAGAPPIPLGHDEATLAARGSGPTAVATTIGTMAVSVDGGGSGLDLPTLDASTAGGVFVGGGLAVAGLLLIGAELTARRNRMRSVQVTRSHESAVG